MDRTPGRRPRNLDGAPRHLADLPLILDLPGPLGELFHRLQPVIHLLEHVATWELVAGTIGEHGKRRSVLPGVVEVVHGARDRDAGHEQRGRLAAGQLIAVRHAGRLGFRNRPNQVRVRIQGQRVEERRHAGSRGTEDVAHSGRAQRLEQNFGAGALHPDALRRRRLLGCCHRTHDGTNRAGAQPERGQAFAEVPARNLAIHKLFEKIAHRTTLQKKIGLRQGRAKLRPRI